MASAAFPRPARPGVESAARIGGGHPRCEARSSSVEHFQPAEGGDRSGSHLLARLHAREVALRLLQAGDLGLALVAARVEVRADPGAVAVDGVLQVHFGGVVRLLRSLVLLSVNLLALEISKLLLLGEL